MTQQSHRPTEVLGALPHRRPSRRSQKRAAPAPSDGEQASAKRAEPPLAEAASEHGTQPDAISPRGREIVGTMVQAAAELAEIGLSVSARAFKEAVARLPRP